MTTFIVTANPEKSLYRYIKDSKTYKIRDIVCINKENYVIVYNESKNIQIILLPCSCNSNRNSIAECIQKLKNSINVGNVFLILHGNDLNVQTFGRIDNPLEPFTEYKKKLYYYLSEADEDDLYEHLTVEDKDDEYFNKIQWFFL